MRADSERGVVLIMVLVILAGLALMLAEFSRLVLADHSASAAGRVALSAKPLLASGEALAADFLLRNRALADPDTEREPWSTEFPLVLRDISASLDEAEISGKISDENSLFPLAAMFARSAREEPRAQEYATVFTRLTARLLLAHGLSENETFALEKAERFTQAVRRWGGDRGVMQDSEEADHYLEGSPSYIVPGTRLLSVRELLLLRWEDLSDEDRRRLLSGNADIPGLMDLLTLWSPGPMNINTLHPLLVHALVESPAAAGEFTAYVLRFRESEDNALEKGWYHEAASKAASWSGAFPFTCVDVSSAYYRVSLKAHAGAASAGSAGFCRVENARVQWFSRFFH